MHEVMLSQAKEESDLLAERLGRMAELEMRKQLLASKRACMDKAFVMAKETLLAKSDSELRAFFMAEVVENAMGDETLCFGDSHASWQDDSFLADCNKELIAKNKQGLLTLSQEKVKEQTGVVLQKAGTEIYLTIESILDNLHSDMETEIATILFAK